MTSQSQDPNEFQDQLLFSEMMSVSGWIDTSRHETVQSQVDAWDAQVSRGMEVIVSLDDVKRLIQAFGLDWDHAFPEGRQIVLGERPVLEILEKNGSPTQFNVIVAEKGAVHWSSTSAQFLGLILTRGNPPIDR